MGQTRVVRWSEIEEKTLFYNDEDAGSVERLYRMAGEEEYLHIAGALKAHRLKAAVSGILHGGPGTGKTELVRQVARDFPFTGGHIDNVATRAIIESIMDGSDTVTLESLINYSKDESHFTNKDSRRRIGF